MLSKILVCDVPDEVTKLRHRLLLWDPSLRVEVATSGDRAVEMAAGEHPEVVVTELTLEGVRGSDLIRKLRESAPTSRSIACSRVRDPLKIAQVLGAGAAGYVLKEEGAEEVIRAIRASLEGVVTLSPGTARILAEEFGSQRIRLGELERQVIDAEERLEEGTMAKAEFLANISHELRTPVTVAKGVAHVLANQVISASERDEFNHTLMGSLDKLAGLVDELIALAELERDTFELDIESTDLAPLIRRAIATLQTQHQQSEISFHLPNALRVPADGPRVVAVVRELLDNACRYSPRNQPILLRARNLDEGIVVSITDSGQGLRRDVLLRSFEQPFSTGEATLRKEKAGAGLGLHLARQLIVRHGGILWADPLPGGGSRVSFCLPSRAGVRMTVRPSAA